MIKKCFNFVSKNNIIFKIPKRPFSSNTLNEKERAEEKNYILR